MKACKRQTKMRSGHSPARAAESDEPWRWETRTEMPGKVPELWMKDRTRSHLRAGHLVRAVLQESEDECSG